MQKILVTIVLLVMGSPLLAQQALNNDSVLKMIKMGFPENMIVNAINQSPGAYDTSGDALIALKKAGVSNNILAAMVRSGGAEPHAKPANSGTLEPAPASVVHAGKTPSANVIARPGTAATPAAAGGNIPVVAVGQSGSEIAKRVYALSENSVFLIYLNDSSGNPSALGSAFLVAPRMLITNAHVADAGEPFLAIGPRRFPLTLVNKDEQNDLAVLSSNSDLTALPLPLAKGKVTPGEEIFAIGNPEGLEKTISEGIVSGIREQDNRQLLQITSPISHGSSGGPILNSEGEVVGVAVGMLDTGQNLNFAVPTRYVQSLLERKANTNELTIDLSRNVAAIKNLIEQRVQDDYSTDSSSPYQLHTNQLIDLVNQAVASSTSPDVLTQVACWGTTSLDLSDAGIRAARTLVRVYPSSDNRALLAYVLYDRSQDEGAAFAFAADGSPEKDKAEKAHNRYLTDAEDTIRSTSAALGASKPSVMGFVLAAAKDEREQLVDAISLNTELTTASLSLCGSDLRRRAYQSLILENNKAHKPGEAEKWFRRYAALYQPQPYEWDREGDRRSEASDAKSSADAYERAARAAKGYGYDFCYAATARRYQAERNPDAVLSDGRECIKASVERTDKGEQVQFAHELPLVYRFMAEVFEERGVYQQGLEYAKESLALEPGNGFSLDTEALLLEDLERYSECVAAEQSAIRASDGKYSWMHFRLGNCFFDSHDWDQAAASFRVAAQADKSDAASAFNLGLSLSRQGYNADATQWFREALTRNPDNELRKKILAASK